MGKIKFLLSLLVVVLISTTCAKGQVFPEYFNDDQYDISQGRNGFLRLINYEGTLTPSPNKAIIFATGVTTSKGVQKKDLFRLTSTGVHTFNSPFNNYDVRVDFARQDLSSGSILGTRDALRIYGENYLSLGIKSDPSLISIGYGSTIFSNNIVFDSDLTQFLIGKLRDAKYPMIGSTIGNTFLLTTINTSYLAHNMILDGSYPAVYVGMATHQYEQIPNSLKTKYSLFVRNGVLSEDYAIAPIDSWADFVFDQNYALPNLSEVETFISENKHLPDLPSESQVASEGYSQHEMNKLLLQKIEELTLYTIDQQKQIDQLKTRLSKYE